ncbi:hypothetical protein D3C75_833680 [compost metagenome]
MLVGLNVAAEVACHLPGYGLGVGILLPTPQFRGVDGLLPVESGLLANSIHRLMEQREDLLIHHLHHVELGAQVEGDREIEVCHADIIRSLRHHCLLS